MGLMLRADVEFHGHFDAVVFCCRCFEALAGEEWPGLRRSGQADHLYTFLFGDLTEAVKEQEPAEAVTVPGSVDHSPGQARDGWV